MNLRASGGPCAPRAAEQRPCSPIGRPRSGRPTFGRFALAAAFVTAALTAAPAPLPFQPDIVVAADGSGDFKTIHEAVQSVPRNNRERRVILVKSGVYTERVRVDAACITLRGESRAGTRLEFSRANTAPRDALGVGVLNLSATAHDFVLENLTVRNTHGQLGIHAFAIYGRADRTVIQDCDVLSQGNDTLSLWRGRAENAAEDAGTEAAAPGGLPVLADGGRYYHARLNVCGSVDFICPRGWCYLADSTITQLNPGATASMWHDGSNIADKKFVLRGCRFDGPPGWQLARRHHDGHFYFIDCSFAATMRDQPPYRVIYPLNGGTPTEADKKRNADYDRTNVFGDRNYFFNSHRAGGDYAWHRDNLASAPGAPRPDQITAKWTFAGTWDPERTDGPRIVRLVPSGDSMEVVFSESVTVKGTPRLRLRPGGTARYASGSGGTALRFRLVDPAAAPAATLDLAGGAIIATEAGANLRPADLTLP